MLIREKRAKKNAQRDGRSGQCDEGELGSVIGKGIREEVGGLGVPGHSQYDQLNERMILKYKKKNNNNTMSDCNGNDSQSRR